MFYFLLKNSSKFEVSEGEAYRQRQNVFFFYLFSCGEQKRNKRKKNLISLKGKTARIITYFYCLPEITLLNEDFTLLDGETSIWKQVLNFLGHPRVPTHLHICDARRDLVAVLDHKGWGACLQLA